MGFGTVTYTDYKDDGEVFNGSVEWYEYVGGTLTGGALGAGVGGIIGIGGPALVGASASASSKFITDLYAYSMTGASFGTWEDYSVAFISGGFLKGIGMNIVAKTAYDVAGRPIVNQLVKVGTNRQETIDGEKILYDFVTRFLTTFAPSPWKAFMRGHFKGMWKLNKQGYFE